MRIATLIATLFLTLTTLAEDDVSPCDDLVGKLLRRDTTQPLVAEYRAAVDAYTADETIYRNEAQARFERGTPLDIRDCFTQAHSRLDAAT
jgi:hypothetical protein